VTGPRLERRPIRRLRPTTIERIAAGEVVERPASVVKELLENALDAGATAVTVRLEGGGLQGIEVADNGAGIPPEELELAIERHATSKLAPEGPVDAVEWLGFRGEALAAIASVSRLHLLSRPPDREVGEGIAVVGGAVTGRYSAPRAIGTTVTVESLFFNTPARRKFLKSPAAEQLEVVRTVERTYIAHPAASIRIEGEGRELVALSAAVRVEDAAARVLGPGLLTDGFPVDGAVPGGRVRGVLGRPATAAATSSGLFLAVNGRAIASRALLQSVRAAFTDTMPRGRFPVGVLYLELDPTRVDVNVHPTKREVRFERERDLFEAVRRCVREGLRASPTAAELAPERGPERAGAWPPSTPPSGDRPRAGAVSASPVQRRLETDAPAPAEPEERPESASEASPAGLVLIGCVRATYWIAESGDALELIDQHAASERVVYEELLRTGQLARQTLVAPVAISLTASQRSALGVHAEAIRASGFEIEPFGRERYRVRAVPSYRGRRARPEAIRSLLDELVEGGRSVPGGGLRERTAASIACHAAIRAGDAIAPEEFRRVLRALSELDPPAFSCPHGRPIRVRFSRSRLDRWFLRTGA